jgi:hypothetical protein
MRVLALVIAGMLAVFAADSQARCEEKLGRRQSRSAVLRRRSEGLRWRRLLLSQRQRVEKALTDRPSGPYPIRPAPAGRFFMAQAAAEACGDTAHRRSAD